MDSDTSDVERLLELGFVEAGRWEVENTRLVAKLTQHATTRNILYAFITDSEVLYIGKSTQSASGRMQGYESPGPTQRTNIRIGDAITKLLKAGTEIRILVFKEREPLFYRGVRVNLAAGLEDELILQFLPRWNRRGTGPARPRSSLPHESSSGTQTGEDGDSVTWGRICAAIGAGQVIHNWSAANGFTGGSFEVVEVAIDHIVVDPPKARNRQTVPRPDFESVLSVWPQYLAGSIPRSQLRELTRYSSYIISM